MKLSSEVLGELAAIIISEAERLRSLTCKICGSPLPLNRTGRPPIYCSASCRSAARREREKAAAP